MSTTFEQSYFGLVNSAMHDMSVSLYARESSETVLIRPLVMPDRATDHYGNMWTLYDQYWENASDEYVLADVVICEGIVSDHMPWDIMMQLLLVTHGLCDCMTRGALDEIRTLCWSCIPANELGMPDEMVSLLATCTDMNQL